MTLVIFLVIQNFVAQPYQVQQMSMENTLQPGEYVLVDKLTPRIDDYSRGDVVVFSPPAGYDQGGNTPFIKRVIGLPGDSVAVHYQPTEAPPDRAEWTIGSDELFVLGDHREASSDSRVFGPIKRDTVIGRAWLRYWPLNVFGILPTPTYPELQAATP